MASKLNSFSKELNSYYHKYLFVVEVLVYCVRHILGQLDNKTVNFIAMSSIKNC